MNATGIDSAAFIQFLKHQRFIVDYAMWSACAIFIYDYILMLHLEIKLIWCSRWSYTKVFFLLVRYMSFAAAFVIIYERSTPNLSAASCGVSFRMAVWLLNCAVTLSQIVLSVRTWVVWNMNRMIGIGLCVLLVIDAAIRFPVLHMFLKMTENGPPPYPGYRGCFITKSTRIVSVNYAATTAIQTCSFALMAISAFRAYRRGSNSELSNIVYKDGIMFYIYLLGFMIMNLNLTVILPLDMMLMLSPMEEFVHTILTARIILTIRDVGNSQGMIPELHTRYTLPLQFGPNDQQPSDQVVWTASDINMQALHYDDE